MFYLKRMSLGYKDPVYIYTKPTVWAQNGLVLISWCLQNKLLRLVLVYHKTDHGNFSLTVG